MDTRFCGYDSRGNSEIAHQTAGESSTSVQLRGIRKDN